MERSKIAIGAMGVLLGVLVGVAATLVAQRGDEPELRPVVLVGGPRLSVGDAVLPVEVANAGEQTFTVTDVRLDLQDGSEITVDLTSDGVEVAAGAHRTVEAVVSRPCTEDDSVLRGAVVVSVSGASGTEAEVPVELPGPLAGVLTGFLQCSNG